MSHSVSKYIEEKIRERKEQNTFRKLFLPEAKVDFFSNDYLGIATNKSLAFPLNKIIRKVPHNMPLFGATGSRLLSGNSQFVEDTETLLANIHQTEAALLFNSGYNANLGVLSALPYKNATIFYDELIHASMHDGIKMSKAKATAFKHNSIKDLEEKLAATHNLKFIAIEALYSMDGDFAPLKEIVALAKKYDAAIILDEAHSTGIYGEKGEGWAQQQNLHQDIFIRIHTFGKAAGVHGAVVLCNESVKSFLVNYSRPFIFSTAMPLHSVCAIRSCYEYFASTACEAERKKLMQNIQLFSSVTKGIIEFKFAESPSAIQTLFIPGNENAKTAAEKIRQQGFEVRAILSPTVAKDTERIRICLHSFNTTQEINDLLQTISYLK
ncbi:MAG: aminotransferase class I/II-fold pyridoxal phosphate-dependent enzyme [Chitinophagales bacterium]|nr:aminotransferase class I/II-fold pyridoxal phosphate-dependent enzyme [Chitinophagales bacterium]